MAEAQEPNAAQIQPGVVPEGYKVLKEGVASILMRGNDVFYNEAQVTNRDLSVAVLREFLPILAQEHADGKYRKQRQVRRQQRKLVNAGKEAGTSNQHPADEAQQASAQQEPNGMPEPSTAQGQDEDMLDAASGAPDQGLQGPDQGQQGPREQAEGEAGVGTSEPGGAAQHPKQPRPATILEGLAASGLRSIRYALEVPNIKRIDANDLDKTVCESMRRNVALNGGKAAELIRTLHSDARITMMQAPLEYDAIDLDPYGTPAQLLDTAVQSVAEGGLLLITATDMANLCGNNNVSCWSSYGSYPLHRAYCHEQALRILLACVEANANRYKRYIKPLLSVSVDFYIRVFVRVYTSAAHVKDAPCRVSYVWQSSGCDSFWLQPVGQKRPHGNSVKYMPAYGPAVPSTKCPDTGSNYTMGGPIWSEPIHDHDFVKQLIKSLDQDKSRYAQYTKVRGVLQSVAEELPDVPLYYDLHEICKTAKCVPFKSETFRSALINAGYRVSGSHANPLAIKTDAPPNIIWDIIRCWIKDHPTKLKDAESYAAKLLAKEPELQASFARAQGAINKKETPRFVQNPAYWGPKSKHGRVHQVGKPVDATAAAPSAAAEDANHNTPAAAAAAADATKDLVAAPAAEPGESGAENTEAQEAKRQRTE